MQRNTMHGDARRRAFGYLACGKRILMYAKYMQKNV